MNERHRQAYVEEASELLRELEGALLELEERPDDLEIVGRVFRALHTIKGSGSMFGFDAIAAFTHELETVFDRVREGGSRATPELIAVTLDARDHIVELLHAYDKPSEVLTARSSGILKRLREAAPVAPQPAADPVNAPVAVTAPAERLSYRIVFRPEPAISRTGTNPILLLRELAELGDFSITARVDDIPMLEEFEPEECYTGWEITLTTTADENAIRDVFIFVEDRAEVTVERVETAAAVLSPADRRLSGRSSSEPAATLRVPAAKLDTLVNVVGELVTVQARLSNYALSCGDSEIHFISEEIERLAEVLREASMSIRMLPIGDTFSRFKRLVHDLSATLGKKAELTTEGDETELDKTVIEQLTDPLVHLIRNAVDHGIESPERRAAAGKPAVGRVRLSATHSGAFVLLTVADDGAGMDRDAIRSRAVERGLISPDAVLTDQQIFALTLQPGFSTAQQVTAVSGRGVGMDVVHRGLEQIRGGLTIDSIPGQGTAVTLKIPLTLAIIEGLLVAVEGEYFVLPLSSIVECIEIGDRQGLGRRNSLVTVRGELTPYIVLREQFGIPGQPPRIEQVIVAETRRGRCGFVVDRVIGDHHTVVKKLGSLYRDIEQVSGATILGDGTVALILDADKIAAELHGDFAKAS